MEAAAPAVVGQGRAEGLSHLPSSGTCHALPQPRVPPGLAHHLEAPHCPYNQANPVSSSVNDCETMSHPTCWGFCCFLVLFTFSLMENFSHSQN